MIEFGSYQRVDSPINRVDSTEFRLHNSWNDKYNENVKCMQIQYYKRFGEYRWIKQKLVNLFLK